MINSIAMALIVALAPVSPGDTATKGCRIHSDRAVEVLVFEDASTTMDAGDLIGDFKLDAGQTSGPVESSSKMLRFKVRSPGSDNWRWVSKTACRQGGVIKL